MIKNIIYKSTLLMFLTVALSSCLDYDDLRENPNQPNSVPPSLIFADLIPGPLQSFNGGYEKMQHHMWIATDNTYPPNFNGGHEGSFNYSDLRNINKMIEEGARVGAPEYEIVSKFLKARIYIEMTRRMGDIPLSQAVLGAEQAQPAYDKQEDVYLQCLNWLDEANTELGDFIQSSPATTLEGDLYYGGDLRGWQRLNNAFTLRVLVSLSKKENFAKLDVKGRFNAIISNPAKYPLMEGNFHNAQFEYSAEEGFKQQYNPDAAVYKDAIVYANTYIDILKAKQDPRLMKVADPTRAALESNPGNPAAVIADFDSYEGGVIEGLATENSSRKLDGEFSFPNDARFWNYVGQPGIFMSYWEQEMHIAEAANRGWITEDAKTHYDNGVSASMRFYDVDAADITDYITNKQPYIAGTNGLTRILEEKFIAFAENSDHESFFTVRRTGVPAYRFTELNNSITKYPVRWTYPDSEDVDNKINYRAALNAQFGSEVDDRDQVLWILKD